MGYLGADSRGVHGLESAVVDLLTNGTMIVVIGPDGRVRAVNPPACAMLGRGEAELLGSDWFEVAVPPGERGEARDTFQRLVRREDDPESRFQARVVTASGEERVIAWRSALLLDDEGGVDGVVRTGDDVTTYHLAEQRAEFLQHHDPLTGLPNRRLLEEHLALAVARARRNETSIAVLYLDLDGFALVNDSLGHAAGDEALRMTAQRLRDVTRANDVIARPGGDRFVFMLSDLEDGPLDAATVVGRLIREALARPYRVAGAEFHLSASIGVSVYPEHADNADDLLRRAEMAMQQARRSGSGPAFYEPDAVDSRTRLSMTSRLRRALDRDEFELHFQPVFATGDQTMLGAEALIRWNDPEQGFLLPAHFIPTAEESGVIEGIGAWVLDALCKQAREWSAYGPLPRLSFNLSPREMLRSGLVPDIIERVVSYGLEPSSFCVEITESSAMCEPERTSAMLRDLNEAGFVLAIDDFGTGHSSLTRLRDLPVQILKVDRSFLAGVPTDPQAGAIVAAILGLGRALGMTTIAEGIETPEQLAFLVEHRCDMAQGFLLGRPAPAADLTEVLRRGAQAA
ncbi:MAG: diguanylate cyclase/phosphodiesterase (GGDEF & EAL domains) with PAS/PAC sensor(s) [uncultured Solirubrobacteraceae bacterium]|uniref:Diguanylate cyclase/phosphodiesterase (GGDEF & EAL domains) with PAS/PAC sensor(S) n=1 Tax=uncultured Solirubrobacteraceae bacterium TaxID=1162706 RepID=A0A6J4SWT2_9ACTN|nr:MAG: diguanylate cyclase/phosphodiesterase (GGDEF & EAL domains) with PAS/PAC sensor(s) [uncultured Solirubrobacteraceae bacterium]